MAVSLVKGGNVSLTKEAPSMNVALGIGSINHLFAPHPKYLT